jgi:hypothetical protein
MNGPWFRFYDRPKPVDLLVPWGSFTGEFVLVLGYTVLGDFILQNPITHEYAILLTMMRELEPTGYDDAAEFRAAFLAKPEIVKALARPELTTELEQRLGPLGKNEVYIPAPYPFLGGSGAPETYGKGDVWTFAALVGQSHGM